MSCVYIYIVVVVACCGGGDGGGDGGGGSVCVRARARARTRAHDVFCSSWMERASDGLALWTTGVVNIFGTPHLSVGLFGKEPAD